MERGWERNFGECELGDRRLGRRAARIGKAISEQYGQGLSSIFEDVKNLMQNDANFGGEMMSTSAAK